METKFCQTCNKSYTKPRSCGRPEWIGRKYCSHACGYQARNKGKIVYTCQTCGKAFTGVYRKAKACSADCRQKAAPHGYWLGKKRPDMSGYNNHRYNGGITSTNHTIRNSPEYKVWRKTVFERDDYTCQMCGVRGGVELNADHLLPFSLFPDLRFEVLNGQTLCKSCHVQTPTHGTKVNSLYKLELTHA